MARFFGTVGYSKQVESPIGSGIWVDNITEMQYFGDVITNSRKIESTDKLNPNVTAHHSISIVADDYAFDNFFYIKYVDWAGVKWTVTDVEVRNPRLILRLGGVFNGSP